MQPIEVLRKITQHPLHPQQSESGQSKRNPTLATGSAAKVGFDPANVELGGFNCLARSSVNGELNCIIVSAIWSTGVAFALGRGALM